MANESTAATERDTESLYVTDAGDYETTSTGIRLDTSPRTKCLLALKAIRGAYWADPDYGSRLRTRKTLRDFERSAQDDCQEALQFLVDRGEILGVTVTELEQDPSTGSVRMQVAVQVTSDEVVDIIVQRETP
jgi:phage gp46-like protein